METRKFSSKVIGKSDESSGKLFRWPAPAVQDHAVQCRRCNEGWRATACHCYACKCMECILIVLVRVVWWCPCICNLDLMYTIVFGGDTPFFGRLSDGNRVSSSKLRHFPNIRTSNKCIACCGVLPDDCRMSGPPTCQTEQPIKYSYHCRTCTAEMLWSMINKSSCEDQKPWFQCAVQKSIYHFMAKMTLLPGSQRTQQQHISFLVIKCAWEMIDVHTVCLFTR